MSEHAVQCAGPRVLARQEHPISRSRISDNALRVLYRLHRAGFTAYLVGGAVRDLLLGRTPKDFDVGTNARPQQVRRLFHNCRLIGRRFRLAHVVFDHEIVEVATFRRSPEAPELPEGSLADVLAPVMEAEEYGTPEEDAWRRDFTVNALFYNIADYSVIDFVGGIEDLRRGVVRSIGPPAVRFAEDPVRMMRAVEYAARLGFEIERETLEAIQTMAAELRRAAPARIAYELIESLRSEHVVQVLRGWEERGLLGEIFPELGPVLDGQHSALVWELLTKAEAAMRQGTSLREETLLGTLLLPSFLAVAWENGGIRRQGLEATVRGIVDPPSTRLALSNHRAHILRSALFLLGRLLVPPSSAKVVMRSLRQEGFPVARQLAQLLAGASGKHTEALATWDEAVARVEQGLPPIVVPSPSSSGPKRRRRRRRRRGL